jgi:hypothetical protein
MTFPIKSWPGFHGYQGKTLREKRKADGPYLSIYFLRQWFLAPLSLTRCWNCPPPMTC